MPDEKTPYPGVNSAISTLLAAIQKSLGEQFVGMYLYGSLALGDFDERSSDIDFVVVTDGPVSEETFARLEEMHREFAASDSPWARRIEVVYIPLAAFVSYEKSDTKYPQHETERPLLWDQLEDGWLVQMYTVRERGITVAGPEPRELLAPIDPEALRPIGEPIVATWWEQAQTDPEWLTWLISRRSQSFVVLTLCRLLYTLHEADVASKPAAARWAMEFLGEDWTPLISRALVGKVEDGTITALEVALTLDLLRVTMEHFSAWRDES